MGLPIPCQSSRFTALKRLAIEPIFHVYLNEEGLVVKFLSPLLARDPSVRTRFFAVAEKMANVSHENVVPVIDFGEEEGTPYLVVPLILGKRLDNILARSRGVPLPSKAVLRIVEQVWTALSWAREVGVDPAGLTREKVLVTFDGTVKLIDLGFSALSEQARQESKIDLVRSLLPPFDYPARIQALRESADPLEEHMRTFFSGDLAWQERRRLKGSPSSLPDSAPLLPAPLPPRLPAQQGRAFPPRRFRRLLTGISVALATLLLSALLLRQRVSAPPTDPAVEPKMEAQAETEPAKLKPPTPEATIVVESPPRPPRRISPPTRVEPIPQQAAGELSLPATLAAPTVVPPPPPEASPSVPTRVEPIPQQAAGELSLPAASAAPTVVPPPPPESGPASSAAAIEEPLISPEEGIRGLLDRLKMAYRTGNLAAYLSRFSGPDPLLESEFLAIYREAQEVRVAFHIFEMKVAGESAEISLLQTILMARRNGTKVRLRELQLLEVGAESGEWKVRKRRVVERYAPEGA